MLNSQLSYVNRVARQKKKRHQKQKASINVLNRYESYGLSSDDDLIINNANNNERQAIDDKATLQDEPLDVNDSDLDLRSCRAESDNDLNDSDCIENLVSAHNDSSLPLYNNSHISVESASKSILSMADKFNFPKIVINKMLKVFKTLLPASNLLPTTYASIIKTVGTKPVSLSKYYCNFCLKLCTIQCGKKICDNENCALANRALGSRNISEVVTLDIKEQLKSILARNISLFDKDELFQPFDINSGTYYKYTSRNLRQSSEKSFYTINFNIHTDGAPLVRTTKSSLWPCLASIVELPPQVREQQKNILVLCLWNSSIKPDINLFLNHSIQQLIDLSKSFIITVNDLQLFVNVETQLFLSDLPAKALFWKTINYNGYNACANCFTEGVYNNRQVLYPYVKNNYRQRTHREFLVTAQEVHNRVIRGNKGGSICGIKGKSPLLRIFEYPKQIILDYMHLCCLGHMATLIQRWLPMLNTNALGDIDYKLYSQRFPHNMSVKFNYPLNLSGNWKAKHFRVFLLSIGLPYVLKHLPPIVVSHFALYVMFVKLLHCPKSNEEIKLADNIIHHYCRTASQIYGEAIELFSLHAHLHLPQQVITHGGLCFTSAFCFESFISHLKKKAHGTRNLATQIANSISTSSIVTQPTLKNLQSNGFNKIDINSALFDKYRNDFLNVTNVFIKNINEIELFLRYNAIYITYHTILYDLPFNCSSHIISYKSANSSIQYGRSIIFFQYYEDYYVFIQKYESKKKQITDYVSIPYKLKKKLNEIYPMKVLTQSFAIIPVTDICHKCIEIKFDDYFFLSDVRVDYEHD